MSEDQKRQGWTVMLLLAAMDAIDFKARAEKLPSYDGYAFSGDDLPQLLEPISDSSAQVVLTDFISENLQPANLIVVDQVSTVIRELKDGLEQAIKEFEQEFGYTPDAADMEPVDVRTVIDEMQGEAAKAAEQVAEIVADVASGGAVTSSVNGMVEAVTAPKVDEENHIDLREGVIGELVPDSEIDPRDGTYQSENTLLQEVLDAVSVVDAQVPSEIRSTATDAYNQTIDQVQGNGRQP
jgi:hypothetical protein